MCTQKSRAARRGAEPDADRATAYLGGCGYEAVDTCTAVPKARTRTAHHCDAARWYQTAGDATQKRWVGNPQRLAI